MNIRGFATVVTRLVMITFAPAAPAFAARVKITALIALLAWPIGADAACKPDDPFPGKWRWIHTTGPGSGNYLQCQNLTASAMSACWTPYLLSYFCGPGSTCNVRPLQCAIGATGLCGRLQQRAEAFRSDGSFCCVSTLEEAVQTTANCPTPDPCPYGTTDAFGNCAPKEAGPPSCPSNGSNPINSGTGNKYQREDDYTAGNASPITFRRHYNSLSSASGPLGASWRHEYEREIVAHGTNPSITVTAFAYRPDGKIFKFTKSSSTWVSDADVTYKLERLAVGGSFSGWKLVTPDDDVEIYDTSGRLSSITAITGVIQTLAYDSMGMLSTVTDSFGNALSFAYDSSNHIASVTIPSGQPIGFTYSLDGHIQTVTRPDSTSRTYLYNESASTGGNNLPNALTGIEDESASRFATYEYDSTGAATSSEHAGGVGRVSIIYNSDGSRSVTDALGTARTFSYTTMLGKHLVTGISLICPSCGGGGASSISYDAKGNVSRRRDFNGNMTCFAYDASRNLEIVRVVRNCLDRELMSCESHNLCARSRHPPAKDHDHLASDSSFAHVDYRTEPRNSVHT